LIGVSRLARLAPSPPGRRGRVTDTARRNSLSRLRLALFGATGLAVPLYAFPPFLLAGRRVDLATLFAAAFVLTSLPAVRATRWSRWERLWYAAAALVPLLALLPPRPARFGAAAFSISYCADRCLVRVARCGRRDALAGPSLGRRCPGTGRFQCETEWPHRQTHRRSLVVVSAPVAAALGSGSSCVALASGFGPTDG
jgi:hypothetical protein